MSSPPYAHTHPDFPNDPEKWEPLFTPFGDGEDECQRETCEKCRDLRPEHGHLNKVAFWTAKFAAATSTVSEARRILAQPLHLHALFITA